MNNSEIIFTIFINDIKNEIYEKYKHIPDIDDLLNQVFQNFTINDLKKFSFQPNNTDKKVYIPNSSEARYLVKSKEAIQKQLSILHPDYKITYSSKKIKQQIEANFNKDVQRQADLLLEKFIEDEKKLKEINKEKLRIKNT
tara:strand:- start:87 stop:509 length:423 start_codon:yes stop_codon:yes gene_type:complete